MKRIIMIIAAFALLPLVSDAQVVIRKTQDKNMSSVSATVVKKNVIYKERKLYDAKVGFQQFVEVSPKFDITQEELGQMAFGHTGINYIGGWRFNNWLFAGAGTGLEFAHVYEKSKAKEIKELIREGCESTYYLDQHGTLNAVSLPIYAHVRAYYMRTALAPYSSLSLGTRLAPKDCGVYFDLSTGVDYRINDNYHAYFSLGFWLSRHKDFYYDWTRYDESCGIWTCDYETLHFHPSSDEKILVGGISFRIGVSF